MDDPEEGIVDTFNREMAVGVGLSAAGGVLPTLLPVHVRP